MDDAVLSQEYLGVFRSISGVFMTRNAHLVSEIIVWLISFYDPTTAGFVDVESA